MGRGSRMDPRAHLSETHAGTGTAGWGRKMGRTVKQDLPTAGERVGVWV